MIEPILGFFTSGNLGQFVSRKDSRPLQISANPIQNSQDVPLIVLVSKETVSFGEVFAGVLRDSGRAKIVGQTSLGNVEILHAMILMMVPGYGSPKKLLILSSLMPIGR